jgi:hypothetical protein
MMATDGRTHYEGCWKARGHQDCAERRIAELERVAVALLSALQGASAFYTKRQRKLAEIAERTGKAALSQSSILPGTGK